jgi:hypothetical protein
MPNIFFDLLHEYDSGKPGITIPVELKIGQQSVKVSAKLDTGSTFCIFKREIGEQLGFDSETGVEELISSVTGSFTAYGHSLTLEAFGIELDVMVYFAKMYSFPRNALGRYGWMQQMKLGLVDYEGKLYASRYGAET